MVGKLMEDFEYKVEVLELIRSYCRFLNMKVVIKIFRCCFFIMLN